jgi:hypothetical protein
MERLGAKAERLLRVRALRIGALGAAGFVATLSLSGAASISGVCPDGSMFVVKSADQIPCDEARRVAPDQLPPMRPHYLPRPYAWEQFQARQDPNNPYNVVEATRAAKRLEGGSAAGAPPPPPAPARKPELALSNDEIRALVSIVELSQERAPATIDDPDGADPALRISLARSPAFEARVREAFSSAGQPLDGVVVAFTAEARRAATFHANLTFAQGHVAFHPEQADPRQFGILRGRQGALAQGEITLGYVVLPAGTDPAEPIDVYWNDRRVTAEFGGPATS